MNTRPVPPTSLRHLVLLAPADPHVDSKFDSVWRSNQTYQKLLYEMQRMRGQVYLNEGAIDNSNLSSDGRHIAPADEKSWHLLTMNAAGQVLGCARYSRVHGLSRFHALNLRRAALAKSRDWGAKVRASIRAEMAAAQRLKFSYVEVGGWALAEEIRGTAEALRTVLTTYAWAQHMGGALGISTATERNGSSSILRRLGGRSLEADGGELPPYYDEQYGCQMEMLRFDSRAPNPKYQPHIESLRENLSTIPVICRGPGSLWGTVSSFLPLRDSLPRWTEELVAGFS